MRAAVALALALCAWPAHAQDAPRTDQEVREDAVVDHGWGFTLRAPGPHWRPLGESAARRVNPEAVAGLMNMNGGQQLVISVKPRTSSPRERAEHITGGLPLQQRRVTRLEDAKLCGLPAVVYEVTGSANGNRHRIGGAILEQRGHLYELMAFEIVGAVATGPPPFEALELAPGDGPPPGRAAAGTTPTDVRGIGWRLRAGTFDSATMGVRIEGRRATGLRMAVAAVARALVPGAEVALMDDARQLGLALVPMRATDAASAEAWAAEMRKQVPTTGQAPRARTFALAGSEPIELAELNLPDRTTAWHGVALVDSRSRFQAFSFGRAAPEDYERFLTAALGTVEVLEEGARAELEGALLRGPDPLGRVGVDWSYRNDVYRHFAHDLTWKRSGAWRVAFDEMLLRAHGQGTVVVLESPRDGLRGWIAIWRQRGYDQARLHEWALQRLGKGTAEPQTRDTPHGTQVMHSWIEVPMAGVPQPRALVATSCSRDRLVQIVVVGSGPDLAKDASPAWEVVDGLALRDDDLVAEGNVEGGWRDERLGFELRAPAAGWTVGPQPRPGATLPQSAREIHAKDTANHELMALVIGDVEEGTDSAFYEDYLRRTALGSMSEALGESLEMSSSPIEDEVLSGVPCRHVRAKTGERGRIDVWLLHVHDMHVVLSAVDRAGDGLPPATLRDCFKLLD